MKQEDRKIIIGALRACPRKNDLETVFTRFDIPDDDLQQRVDILLEAMGKPEMFFSTGEPSLKQRYELTIQMFLTMSWKYSLMRKGISF